eukprot:5382945-Prymnesium_polylepis.1
MSVLSFDARGRRRRRGAGVSSEFRTGGGTGGPGPHHVRPAKCAKKGYLNYGNELLITHDKWCQSTAHPLIPSGSSIRSALSSNAKKL